MSLREVLASFSIDWDPEGNLDKGDKKIDGLTEKLLGFGKLAAGAFAVTEIVAWGKAILGDADALAKQSQALGVSAAQLQGWQHAAALSGSSAEEFGASLTKFTRNVAEAGDAAGGPAAKAFKELGVTFKDSAGNLGAPIDLLDGVVAGLENIEDPAKRTALVMDLFGKSGAKLLPLFSEGKEGIAKLRAEVQELGFGFDEAFLENAQEVNDNLDRMKLGLRGVGIQVLSAVLPGITEFSKGAVALGKRLIGWLKGTKLIQAGLIALAAKGVSMVAAALPKLVAKIGTLGKALSALRNFALRAILPFLLLEDAIVFLAGGKSAIGKGLDKIFGDGTAEAARASILKWFNDVKAVVMNDVLPALQSITNSELFQGAAKVALDTVLSVLTLVGMALTDDEKKLASLGDTFLKRSASIVDAVNAVKDALSWDADTIKTGVSDAVDAVEGGLESVVPGFKSTATRELEVQTAIARGRPPAPSQPVTAESVRSMYGAGPAAPTSFFGPQPSAFTPSYYDTARAAASAPAPASQVMTNNNTTNAPITNNVTVNVPPGEGEVGNRVGRATTKALGGVSLTAVKAALVPTPR